MRLLNWFLTVMMCRPLMWEEAPANVGSGSAAGDGRGVESKIETPGLGDNKGASLDLKSLIPAEYAGKGYLKEIIAKNDFVGLLKSLDNSQSLIGKKLGIPTAESTPEEKAKFFEAWGKPKDATEYEIKKEGMDDKALAYFQKMFHEADLSKTQAKKVMDALEKMGMDNRTATKAEEEKMNADFDKLIEETFGDRQDEIVAQAKTYLGKYVPDKLKAALDDASNEVIVAVAAFVDGMVKDYVKEDDLLGRKEGGKTTPLTKAQVQEELSKLYNTPEYRDAFSMGHQAALDREASLSAALKSIINRAK